MAMLKRVFMVYSISFCLFLILFIFFDVTHVKTSYALSTLDHGNNSFRKISGIISHLHIKDLITNGSIITRPGCPRQGAHYAAMDVAGFPDGIKLLINQPCMCHGEKTTKYIIMFHTAPNHFQQRTLLRETWAGDNVLPDNSMRRVFVLGRTLNATVQYAIHIESDEYGDIIQGDFHDTYWNLTVKHLMHLSWVTEYCPQAKFVIKADDDVFVNIHGVVNVLENYRHNKHAIFGYCREYGSSPPSRDIRGKWYVSLSEFPGTMYPTYCIGTMYAISRDIVPELCSLSKSTPFLKIDDVYITGILASKIDRIKHVTFKKIYDLSCDRFFEDLSNKYSNISQATALCSATQIETIWKVYRSRVDTDIDFLSKGFFKYLYTFKTENEI